MLFMIVPKICILALSFSCQYGIFLCMYELEHITLCWNGARHHILVWNVVNLC